MGGGRLGVVVGCTAALAIAACAPASLTSSSEDDSLSQADADAFADLMMSQAQGSGFSDVSPKSFGIVDTGVSPLSSCSPQKLTPVQQCGAGGNIYTTINQSCPDANTAACCGANPACQNWKGSFSGQYKTLYNSCKTSPNVVINGTWYGTMTGSIEGDCGGQVAVTAAVHFNGNLSILVNGHDVCPGFPSLDLTLFAYGDVEITLSGTVCGRPVFRAIKGPCQTQCPGYCCPGGSICSKAGQHCWPAAYPVDCGDYACPANTKCAAGQKCSN